MCSPSSLSPGVLPTGFNNRYFDATTTCEDFKKDFEVEKRDIYNAKDEIVAACHRVGALSKKVRIADIGAGTGLFTREFAQVVAKGNGKVYAVDVTEKFVKHLPQGKHVTPILCTEKSVQLTAQSVDTVFVCDAYHHFDYPKETMESIWTALRPGGKLVLIDFERIEGQSREWVLGHLRAGKEVFRKEIEGCGFVYDKEIPVKGFTENYFTLYHKPTRTSPRKA